MSTNTLFDALADLEAYCENCTSCASILLTFQQRAGREQTEGAARV